MTARVPLFHLADGAVGQLGVLVPDIEQGCRAYGALAGDAPWRVWTYDGDVVPRRVFRGHAGSFSMVVALSSTQLQLELVQPLDGPSLYHEWVDAHGYGLHHLGFVVPDLAAAVDAMDAAGFPLLQLGAGHGADGTGGFAYFDTVDVLGLIVEAIEVPRVRRPPDRQVAVSR